MVDRPNTKLATINYTRLIGEAKRSSSSVGATSAVQDEKIDEISTERYKEIITSVWAKPDAMDLTEETKKAKAIITFKYNDALLKRATDKLKSE